MVRMTGRIVHHQRLAWDCARAFVTLAAAEHEYYWLQARLRELLGPDFAADLSDSRTRLLWTRRPDASPAEAGLWRAKVVDLLGERPELCLALESLMSEAQARAAELSPVP